MSSVWSAGVQQADQSVLVQKLRVTTVETLKQAKELGAKGNSVHVYIGESVISAKY